MNDRRTGRNIQHDMTNLLRQSVYTRLAGYEDVNDAQRLSADPVMRAVTGKKKKKNAASINTIGRFETEILTLRENLEGLSEMSGPSSNYFGYGQFRKPCAWRAGGFSIQWSLWIPLLSSSVLLQPVRRL